MHSIRPWVQSQYLPQIQNPQILHHSNSANYKVEHSIYNVICDSKYDKVELLGEKEAESFSELNNINTFKSFTRDEPLVLAL